MKFGAMRRVGIYYGTDKHVMAQPVLFDLRNIYRPDELARYGFTYESVGRAKKL